MANQQNQNQNQNRQDQQNQQRETPAQEQNGRSEDLLPAGAADNTADGRFEVAEEVNMDQQSDATRRVGKAPKGIASEALADSLKPDRE
jgi:TolA-binding protein